MYKLTHPLFLLCETPLHAGSGDDLGIVDLPIQRERHTSFPKIESSSLKGALREAFEGKTGYGNESSSWEDDSTKVQRIFGFDKGTLNDPIVNNLKNVFKHKTKNAKTEIEKEEDAIEFAGSLAFSDARLLLFPVKSMRGVFVWITCPQVLNKFASDLSFSQNGGIQNLEAITSLNVDTGKCKIASNTVSINNSVVLEEFAFAATVAAEVTNFADTLANTIFDAPSLTYWKGLLKTNLVILSNDDFRDFVNQSTEVITRTKIDNNTGTVQDGALFTEEYLPTDSVLYSLVMASPENTIKKDMSMSESQVFEFFTKHQPAIFQLGGNASIGKGLLRTKLLTN
jgi:CRISPR-associated protein Cmr4